MNNIYEIFLNKKTPFVDMAEFFNNVMKVFTKDERLMSQNAIAERLGKSAEEQKILLDVAIFLKKINYKVNRYEKKGLKNLITQDKKKEFSELYSFFIEFLLTVTKNISNQNMKNHLYLIAIDEYTPEKSLDLLKANKMYITINEDVLEKNYWLNAKIELLEEFNSSWKKIENQLFYKTFEGVVFKINNAVNIANVMKDGTKKDSVDENLNKENSRDQKCGFLTLFAIKMFMENLNRSKGDNNNSDYVLKAQNVIKMNFFRRFNTSNAVYNEIKNIALEYSKLNPSGKLLFPLFKNVAIKNYFLNNNEFLFNINSKEKFEKDEFLNLLSQKNRNDIIRKNFDEIFHKPGKVKINDQSVDVSKIHLSEVTSFSDMKKFTNIQNVPLKDDEWMMIAFNFQKKFPQNEKVNEAFSFFMEKKLKDDIKDKEVDSFEDTGKIKVRSRLKF